MDIIHHTAIGFAGALALSAAGEPLASALFLGASMLPDADVAFMAKSKRAYLKAHQASTHSLPIIAGTSLLTAVLAGSSFSLREGLVAGLTVLISLLIHVLLDVSNTLGTHLMWPWGRRLRLDATFFIDALSWGLTLATLALLMLTGAAWPFVLYLALMVVQILCRAVLSRHVRRHTGFPIAIPDPVVPGRFALTKLHEDGGATMARWTPWGGLTEEGQTSAPSPDARALAAGNDSVRHMSDFARAFVIVDEVATSDGLKITLRDVAMRRLGGRYGEITLERTSKGEVHETINF